MPPYSFWAPSGGFPTRSASTARVANGWYAPGDPRSLSDSSASTINDSTQFLRAGQATVPPLAAIADLQQGFAALVSQVTAMDFRWAEMFQDLRQRMDTLSSQLDEERERNRDITFLLLEERLRKLEAIQNMQQQEQTYQESLNRLPREIAATMSAKKSSEPAEGSSGSSHLRNGYESYPAGVTTPPRTTPSDSSASASPAAGSRQLAQLDPKNIKEFSPCGLMLAKAASISTASSAKPSPTPAWSSVVARPAQIAPPAAQTAATSAESPDRSQVVPRNRKGQRVDQIIPHDKAEVDRVKAMKLCNTHYLRGNCPYGDTCQHDHFYKPTAKELDTLRLVARMAPCKDGSDCDVPKCVYGHNCPAPQGRDGKDCIFGEQCRFPHELHKIDRDIVRTFRV